MGRGSGGGGGSRVREGQRWGGVGGRGRDGGCISGRRVVGEGGKGRVGWEGRRGERGEGRWRGESCSLNNKHKCVINK